MAAASLGVGALLVAAHLALGCGRTPSYVDPGPMDGSLDGAADSSVDSASDGATDAGADAGSESCSADEVAAALCPEVICDSLPQWYWNGDTCFPIDCGACTGLGCDGGDADEASCIAAHEGCEASLCRNTGGTYRWWAEDCGHWECGRPAPVDCEVGAPSCDCGVSRSFDEATGCFDDPTCPPPIPAPEEVLCRESGGAWETICCHTDCGEICPEPCVSPACNCGPGRVFEGVRGCVEAAHCFERGAGQTCAPEARCEANTLCCEHCTGAGCSGPPTCEPPVCGDETVDVCGNDLMAP